MCGAPKAPKPSKPEKPTILLNRRDTEGTADQVARRRRSDVRLDLNNGTQRYQGLMIPGG